MSDTAMVPRNPDGQEPAVQPVVGPELADQLLARAEAGGVELLGPDGLLSQVTKSVLERALAEEMTGHLGYENTTRPGGAAATAVTGPRPSPC
jgi:putative transposase